MVEGKDDDEEKRTVTTTRYTTNDLITKRYTVPSEVWESKQKKLTLNRHNKTGKDNWTKKQTNNKKK